MSLVIAAVCTDGIVVSGDFRISHIAIDPKTKEKVILDWKDNSHKIIKTKSNRIIGHTGNANLSNGELLNDTIQNILLMSDILGFSMYKEFEHIIGAIGDNENALIEAGIVDGRYTVLIWKQGDSKITVNYYGGAIGATEYIDKQGISFENKLLSMNEAEKLLQRLNTETAKINNTVSPECEIIEIC